MPRYYKITHYITLRKKDNLRTDYEEPGDNKNLLKAHGDLDSNWLQYIT